MSTATCPALSTMPVSALRSHPMNIKVYGDLETDRDFLTSIQHWGIIDPIVYQPLSFDGGTTFENVIVSGHRRFLAARTFKFDNVPVRLAMPERRFDNELDLLEIERLILEANKQRVKSRVQIGREFIELRRIETRSAELRKKAGTSGKDFPKVGRARDIAADALGISGRTAEKLSKIIEKADTGDETAKQVLTDLDEKKVSISAGYLKALNIRSDDEDPNSNRSLRRQAFLKDHPEHVGKKNSVIDGMLALDEQNRPVNQTPWEKECKRLRKLSMTYASVRGDSFNKATGQYDTFYIHTKDFICRDERIAVEFATAIEEVWRRFENEALYLKSVKQKFVASGGQGVFVPNTVEQG